MRAIHSRPAFAFPLAVASSRPGRCPGRAQIQPVSSQPAQRRCSVQPRRLAQAPAPQQAPDRSDQGSGDISAGHADQAGADGDPANVRRRHAGRHRSRQQRAVHREPEEGRLRRLRGRRQAGSDFVPADARRARLQRSGAAAAAADGRHHPAAEQADQRRGRPHLADLRRRPAPRFPEHRADQGSLQEDRERARSRRGHVRHRLQRAVVARDRPDLRSQAAHRGDRQDLGRGPQAAGDSRRAARRGRSVRSAVSRARGVRHGVQHHEEPGAGAQPPQGLRLRQQRLRLQSVCRHAEEAGRRALEVDEPEQRERRRERRAAATATRTRSCGRATSSASRIWPRSSRS